MNRQLLITFNCLFLVMVGFGVALAVLPYHVDRLAAGAAMPANAVALHVGAVTGIYALAQFIGAPPWGRWSDRRGRRAALLISLGGSAVSQVLFGVAAIAIFVVGSALIASSSLSEAGLATGFQGSATCLVQILGPLGAGILFARRDALPFFFTAILMLAASGWLLWRWRRFEYPHPLQQEITR